MNRHRDESDRQRKRLSAMASWHPDCYQRAVAYVTDPGGRLLVFDHIDVDAGTQVPAGGVHDGESAEDAVLRELAEESGSTLLRVFESSGRHGGDPSLETCPPNSRSTSNTHSTSDWISHARKRSGNGRKRRAASSSNIASPSAGPKRRRRSIGHIRQCGSSRSGFRSGICDRIKLAPRECCRTRLRGVARCVRRACLRRSATCLRTIEL
jgi:ADP-ribose pyrophosphatase YjhB (NUDIX family)